jgi:hypothetical protein
MICPNPNCHYHGKPERKSRGSVVIGFILCFFFLVPGLLYFMLRSGYRNLCPKCGLQISADT